MKSRPGKSDHARNVLLVKSGHRVKNAGPPEKFAARIGHRDQNGQNARAAKEVVVRIAPKVAVRHPREMQNAVPPLAHRVRKRKVAVRGLPAHALHQLAVQRAEMNLGLVWKKKNSGLPTKHRRALRNWPPKKSSTTASKKNLRKSKLPEPMSVVMMMTWKARTKMSVRVVDVAVVAVVAPAKPVLPHPPRSLMPNSTKTMMSP